MAGVVAEMMLPLAQPFYSACLEVLFYDACNHGKSDSDSFSSLPRFSEDLDAAIRWVKQKKYDKESGNYYNYFRGYDPSTDRYLQSDHVGQTYNLVDHQLQLQVFGFRLKP